MGFFNTEINLNKLFHYNSQSCFLSLVRRPVRRQNIYAIFVRMKTLKLEQHIFAKPVKIPSHYVKYVLNTIPDINLPRVMKRVQTWQNSRQLKLIPGIYMHPFYAFVANYRSNPFWLSLLMKCVQHLVYTCNSYSFRDCENSLLMRAKLDHILTLDYRS